MFSSFWILANNSWMQVPLGHPVVDGRFVPEDWKQIVPGPVQMVRWPHMLLAAFLTTAMWPNLEQMVVGMVLHNTGNPLCSAMWPGNTTDVTSLTPVVKRLQKHFAVQRVCIVADRGMISDTTIADIESRGGCTSSGCACAAPRRLATRCSRAPTRR